MAPKLKKAPAAVAVAIRLIVVMLAVYLVTELIDPYHVRLVTFCKAGGEKGRCLWDLLSSSPVHCRHSASK